MKSNQVQLVPDKEQKGQKSTRDIPVWFSIKKAQSYLCLSASTIRRAIATGQLRHRRVNTNGKILIHRNWVNAWIMNFDSRRLTRAQKQILRDLG